jgi:hypothetical protein
MRLEGKKMDINKACPFCGGKDILFVISESGGLM